MADLERTPHQPTSFIEQMMMVEGDPNVSGHNWEHIAIVAEALEKLEPASRFLIELRFFQKFPYSKITALMGYSSKSVAWYNVNKALEELRCLLLTDEEINDKYG